MSTAGLALERWRQGFADTVWTQRLADAIPVLPVALSMLVLGVALLPEITVAVPSLNDDAAHYSLILNASRAIDAGQNPFDHWAPDLEIGYPQFAYYQHLPHLFVVGLERLTLKQVDLLTLFNLTRYVLLVGFPLTVYWSLRQLGFSRPASGTAAALAPLLSAGHRFGLEYDSYVWRGFGMYTQLWAMHLSFLSLAVVQRTLTEGKGYFWSVLVLSALVLSHVIYAFVIAITLGFLLLSGLTRANLRERLTRMALVGGPALLVTSYFWLPLILNAAYHTTSPYMEDWKYDSHGASQVLSWLGTGKLFDHDRLPVITGFAAVGVLVALWTRTRLALFALAVGGFWLVAYFGRPTLGGFADLLSFDGRLWMHRFIGPMQLGGLLLIAVAAGWLWQRLHAFKRIPWPAAVFGVVVLAVTITALVERWDYLDKNHQWMQSTDRALAADEDMAGVVATLKDLPPGRVFAGQRSGFSDDMKVGDLRVADILTFNQIETAAPPYQSLSLNSDLIWHFDYRSATHYEILNARYAVLPAGLVAPDFLEPLLETERYTLYEAPATGYVGIAETPTGFAGAEEDYHIVSRAWFLGTTPGEGVYPAFALDSTPRLDSLNYEPLGGASTAIRRLHAQYTPDERGAVINEDARKFAYEADVTLNQTGTVLLRATYHPDWRAYVDGEEVEPFMVAPSFPAIQLGPGEYHVRFQYKPNAARTPLLIIGFATLGLVGLVDSRRGSLRRLLHSFRA